MTTKLTVAHWKLGNDCVKGKRKKGKEKGFFPFFFPVFGWTAEVGNDTSHFLTSAHFLESKQPLRQRPDPSSSDQVRPE